MIAGLRLSVSQLMRRADSRQSRFRSTLFFDAFSAVRFHSAQLLRFFAILFFKIIFRRFFAAAAALLRFRQRLRFFAMPYFHCIFRLFHFVSSLMHFRHFRMISAMIFFTPIFSFPL
jgi:hypothetical protein